MRLALPAIFAAFALLTHVSPASALDKQGSAHGGKVGGDDGGMALTGSLLAGAAIYNPTYAARPDNSGRALVRIAPHFDFDLIGRKLSIPLDLNMFTDRRQNGFAVLKPSELDVISGLTTTWTLGAPTALEFGARFERDMPVDRSGVVQSYADTRLKLLYSLGEMIKGLNSALGGGNLGGSLTLGWFSWNPTYAARPDNSGHALLRYDLSVGATMLNDRLGIGTSVTAFTDRDASALAPSEVDVAPGITYHWEKAALQISYERDMPIDRKGLIQQLVMASASFDFELWTPHPHN
ncbi:MAG TPA: hypothetical protein VHM70_25865 [Polyangiaceae bacterium]|jgi:hypothetical protein|nr:hypothetical protein [Polyangiaceae bacterium]